MLFVFAKLFGWMALGFLGRKFPKILLQRNPKQIFAWINRFILVVSLPATMLVALHSLKFDLTLLFPVSMAWIIFGVAFLIFPWIGKRLGLSHSSIGALILTGGLGNTSFVGFPLLVAIYGESALKIGVLTDQPGSFLVLSTVGILSAVYFASLAGQSSDRGVHLAHLFKRIIKFPPIWALLLSIAFRPVSFSSEITQVLKTLGATLIPLALISVGSRLVFKKRDFEGREKALALGLGYKLIAAPTIMLILAWVIGHWPWNASGQFIPLDVARITILEAAMAPMITGAIIAEENGLDPELCSLMVSIGIPISLVSVPLLAKLLEIFI